ncbi:hypothetical protein GCM10010345_85040 [Streptomyces canarius]|uniref:Uncharacterized protein n=1 Tax=Streptomyces canarius TaxID=285453 RepID=A0ABQ3DB11_9ACTN|nr:hypothetical protein GCM10010345_85040 [Streptomyces canarius]
MATEKQLRGLVYMCLFPLRVIAGIYWLLIGWMIHRPSGEEREALHNARRAATATPGPASNFAGHRPVDGASRVDQERRSCEATVRPATAARVAAGEEAVGRPHRAR